MIALLLIGYVLCGVATVGLAMWISVADDAETYFWGLVLWPLLLIAVACSILRSWWTGGAFFHEDERARIRGFARPGLSAGAFRFRMKRRFKGRR